MMSHTVEIDPYTLAVHYCYTSSIINLVDLQSRSIDDSTSKRFNFMVKLSGFAVKEIGDKYSFFDSSARLDKQIKLEDLNNLIRDFQDLIEIIELAIDIDDFDDGSEMEELHYSLQGAFSLLHAELTKLWDLLPEDAEEELKAA